MRACAAAGGDRFAVYDLENHEGTPVYVHAKAVVVDDVWAMAGSDVTTRRRRGRSTRRRPRYGWPGADRGSRARRRTCRTDSTRIAMQPQRATAAAVCPDGKLAVGGATSSRTTAGRGRWTVAVTEQNTTSSPTRATTRTEDSYHRPSRQRSSSTTTTVTAMAACVSAIPLPNAVTLFQTPVRWAANQTSARRSTDCNRPWTRTCVTSTPIKNSRPHSATAPPARRRATVFPAADRVRALRNSPGAVAAWRCL
jgi:hypothetical protein